MIPPLSIRMRTLAGKAASYAAAFIGLIGVAAAAPALAIGWTARRLGDWGQPREEMAQEWLRLRLMSPAENAEHCFDFAVVTGRDGTKADAAECAEMWRRLARDPDSPIHHWTERDWIVWDTVYWRCFDERAKLMGRET